MAYLVVGFDVEFDLLAGKCAYSVSSQCPFVPLLKVVAVATGLPNLICMLTTTLLVRPGAMYWVK